MTIGWIGLGNMGAPMAANLVAAGHHVTGFDLSERAGELATRAGVSVVDSVAEAVRDAAVVFTMLPAGEHVRSVLTGPDGVLANMSPGGLVVDSSTIDIHLARDLHGVVAGTGRRFLDAPVSGGIFGAQAGTLTFMIGGRAQDLDRVRDVLEAMAGRIFHAGDPGAGQAAKLTNNLMLAVNLAGLCEAAVLADRLGLDHRVLYEIANASSGSSWALRTWYPMPGVVETAGVNRDFEGGFATDLACKDVRLALAAGQATHTPLDFAALALQRLQTLSEAGYGAKDCTALVRLIDGTLPDSDTV